MATLKRIQKNANDKKQTEIERKNNYICPTALTLLSKTIKEQNIILIEWICNKYDLSTSEKDDLMATFIKINYYCPNKILSTNREKLQKIFIK